MMPLEKLERRQSVTSVLQGTPKYPMISFLLGQSKIYCLLIRVFVDYTAL
jgi:hypothetical protein